MSCWLRESEPDIRLCEGDGCAHPERRDIA